MTKTTAVPVNVEIMGKSYTVACPEGEEKNLLVSAKRVDNEMRKVRGSGKVLGSERIAVMVALNLAHELLKCQQSVGLGDNPNTQRITQLNADIESVLQRYHALLPAAEEPADS